MLTMHNYVNARFPNSNLSSSVCLFSAGRCFVETGLTDAPLYTLTALPHVERLTLSESCDIFPGLIRSVGVSVTHGVTKPHR